MIDIAWSDRVLPNDNFNDNFNIADLMLLVERYMSAADASQVHRAYEYAKEAHEGVYRKDGLPYISHPLAVARTLADLHMDADVISAALLHDVVEDCEGYSNEDIADTFNESTAKLVDGVTKLTYEDFPDKQAALIATFRKMMKIMTEDFRVILIKLSDRLHNLSTMSAVPMKTRIKKADESFQLYIPLARRMGMNKMRRELQELALKAKYPWRTKVLEAILNDYVKRNADRHATIIDDITKAFDEKNLEVSVFRWPKNIYRVFTRLRQKGEKLNAKTESLDIRILVSSRTECYQALGILHELYPPKVGTFKDFVATPKVYGFQALETYLLTPSRQKIMVQIQSKNMHKIAQYGVTAKWRNPELSTKSDISFKALNDWLSQVNKIYQYDMDSNDFYSDIKADLFLTEIYVSTPKGKNIILPYGSNSIDFAYAIHTELGNHCAETRVDGKKVSLTMPLYNGAVVEIIASELANPRASWRGAVVTATAMSNIRSWLANRKEEEFIELGKQVFQAALNQYELDDSEIDPTNFTNLLADLDMQDENDLWMALGKGKQCGKLITHRLFNNEDLPKLSNSDKHPMLVSGTEGLVVNLQSCCHPIPEDRITAKIHPIYGLAVHRVDCPTLRNVDLTADDYLTVSWEKTENTFYTTPLTFTAENKIGILSSVTAWMEKLLVNIENISIETEAHGTKIVHLLIKVSSQKHLQKIIYGIRKKEGVISVERPF